MKNRYMRQVAKWLTVRDSNDMTIVEFAVGNLAMLGFALSVGGLIWSLSR